MTHTTAAPRATRVARLFAVAILALAAAPGLAATFTWDIVPGTAGAGDSAITGGTGTWSTTAANWTSNGGATNVAWPNSTADNTIFGGTAGTVTVSGTVNVRQITLNTTGYLITGGTLNRDNDMIVDGAGDATISSDFTLASGRRILKQGANTVTLNGFNNRGVDVTSGTIIAGASARIGIADVFSGGTLVLNSGQSGNLRITDGSAFDLSFRNGATLASSNAAGIDITGITLTDANGTINFGNATYTDGIKISANIASTRARTVNVAANTTVEFSGNLTGAAGSYTKSGLGTAVFSGTNSYTGATVVSNGSLRVNGSIAGSGVTVNGGTLGGNGTINTSVLINSGGTFAPGNSIDQIDIVGNLTVAGDWFNEVLGSTTDRADVTGTIDLSSLTDSLTVSGTLVSSAYVIASYDQLIGTFNSTTGLTGSYIVDYNYQGLKQIALVNTAEIPAPLALPAGFALLGLAAMRRRRVN